MSEDRCLAEYALYFYVPGFFGMIEREVYYGPKCSLYTGHDGKHRAWISNAPSGPYKLRVNPRPATIEW